jgi:hypothetical protein
MGMAREWVKAGHVVHVVTGPGDRGGEYSPDLEDAARTTGAVVHRAAAPGVAIPSRRRELSHATVPDLEARPPVGRLRQILSQWKNFPDHQRSWIGPALGVARRIVASTPVDVVWTTSPPESVHFVGRALARQGIPWIADFRDPWSDYFLARWDPLSRWLVDRVAWRALRPARAFTAASEGIARSIGRATHLPPIRVYNGFDDDVPAREPFAPRSLGYFGRVDPRDQHPERLWPALRYVRAGNTPWTVAFFLTPGGGGGAGLRVPDDLRPSVAVRPTVPHGAALEAMRRHAALLVLGVESARGGDIVPAKVFEYAGSGRPVLVVAPPHFEIRHLVESTRIGVGAWQTDELARALGTLETFQVDEGGRRSMSRTIAAATVLDLIARVVAATPTRVQELRPPCNSE